MIGERFGNWVVIELSHKKREGEYYFCKCDCGTEKVVFRGNLTSGKTKSCGCMTALRIGERRTIHGHAKRSGGTVSPTYSSWVSMLTRCYNRKCKSFSDYGARGIVVCDRWHKFENFLFDMGAKPKKGMSIERINNNGIYEPGNCVWTTTKYQNRNKRTTKLLEKDVADLRNGMVSVKDILEKTGCKRSTAYSAKNGRNWN